jgi:prepilin signal peptidase PulO-like enzyme (type II secretory pathway)
MIKLGMIFILVVVLFSGLFGFYVPWFGKKLLLYRKITFPPSSDYSFILAGLASLGVGAIFLQIEPTLQVGLAWIFFFILLFIGWIDWRTGFILDQLTIGGSIILLGFEAVRELTALPIQLAGSICLYLFLFAIAKWTKRLGPGDAKLMAMCALVMHWQYILFALWLASVSGLVYVAILWIRKKRITQSYALPFGPHLAFGSFFAYLFGEQVIQFFSH